MNRHRSTISGMALLAMLAFSGCINYEQKTTLHGDGSGTMVIHYWTEESVANFMSGDKLVFTEGDLKQQYQTQGVEVDEATVESKTADSTRHVRVTLHFKDINALSNTKGFKGTKFTWMKDGANMVFKQVMEANSSASGLGLEKYTITYTYEMPGQVVSSNAIKVEGSTLTWSYKLPDLSKEVMLTATMKVGGGIGGTAIAIIIGIVIIAAGAIVFFVSKKKNKI